MASKWDDEFDLDEDPQPRSKPNQKKNRNSNHDDFLDLEDEAPQNVKLPVIGKQQPLRNQKNTKNSAEINLVQIPKRKVEPSHSPHDQEYQFQESLAPNPSIKQKSPKAEPKKVVSPPQKEDQEYQNEDFQEQKYQEDFEQHQEHKPSPPPQKPKQQSKEQAKPLSKPQNVPKPVPKDRKGAESVARKPQLNKPNSRNSGRSQSGSRSANNSRSKPEQKKEELPNKYSSLAERTCPSYQRSTLEECNLDRLTRQNDKIRGLIKKFNDELNDLINKNIMQLKTKKEQKVVVPEQIIRVLEEQRNSNETALQNTIKDLQRLKGKQGELKEEEYQLGLQQKITQIKISMGQINRVITKLKLEVNNEGNKLSKIDKDKEATTNMQDANSIKSGLALMKKEQEKNDQILQKLYIKYEQLSRKITQAEGRHTTQLEEAKNKGLSVQLNPQLIKKAEDIKKRIEICRLHKTKTQNLIKTKCQMITHQCDQVKIQIKAVQNSIQVCVSNCEEIQNQGRKIVDKARKNGKISEDILTSLQNIISELEASTPSSNREKEDTSTFTHPKGAKKYQSQKNVEKITPPPQQPKQQTQDDINLKKPTLFKKKEKEEDKPEQRVWKDDKNTQVKKHEKTNSIPELSKFENKEEGERKDEEKKKPFVIKKNKQPKPESDTAIEPPKEETKVQRIQTKKQAEKSEETPSIAPRMMKFRRNKQEEGTRTQQTPKQSIQKPIAVPKQPSKPETKPIEQQSEKPIFAPKRFNLKLKDRNPQEGGYVATVVDKKEEPKPVEQFKPKGLNIQKESLTFTVETKIDPSKAIDVKINTEQDDKPKFNLRLRDRQKVENKVEPPPEVVKEPEAKITITLDDKAKENNQYANPYANAEAPKREREGPLKKQKPAQNIQKQNFNIYEQVEDITNVKEIKMNVEQPKPSVVNIKISAEQPNLHDLLGIKKNKQAVDQDLLVDASILAGKGKGKKESKKDTNFFGDLQL